jgi:hypothetical protein
MPDDSAKQSSDIAVSPFLGPCPFTPDDPRYQYWLDIDRSLRERDARNHAGATTFGG